ncbi:E3 ubiquitin-protein ligase pellino homolog 3 isoform X4 [Myotis myotis]|uniref:E3 ubiquitin-protein ligase pellino homolog 3 isoform X4 n=1 Tax=Myotis myotis TaxID=51298 RepID=UPI00174A6B36|nr:E3 ubiquitin-protein ligase pellino homolog 3 isoform X4 [Myotis myotis]XP_059565985.1 E3 ubiquitin-protein ligase pellino homolog 3 isoform X4 [Myotis daubentonii]
MVLEGNPDVGSPRTSDLQHPGSQGSCILSSGEDVQPGEEPIKYGELIVLGCCEEGGEETEAQRGEVTGPRAHSCYNGCLSSGDKGRRRSRLALNRRPHANGVKPDVMHHISTPLVSKALSNRGQHSISYTLSRSHSVIVEYTHDSDTDMFQIGRSTENMIDFVVTDTSPGGGVAEGPSPQSTISRYACRILCDRRPPYIARIYAAGFDASSNIFLGVENESNVLQDGSLIDLCGATLLWRTPAGLLRAPTLKQLEAQRQEANAARPQCPVGLSTLAFPSPARGRTAPDKQQPWVYVRCGHVHGYHGWGCRQERGPQERECPLCRLVGPYVPLWLGQEAGLCLDPGPPSHAFAPCGHVCSEKTARYWAQTPLPHGTHAFHAACPFCGAWLTGEHGCVRLIFQGPLD